MFCNFRYVGSKIAETEMVKINSLNITCKLLYINNKLLYSHISKKHIDSTTHIRITEQYLINYCFMQA